MIGGVYAFAYISSNRGRHHDIPRSDPRTARTHRHGDTLGPMSTISVVIPCLDDADFLVACLDAVVGQSRPADEIIVVDNGSTDIVRGPDVHRRGHHQLLRSGPQSFVPVELGELGDQ